MMTQKIRSAIFLCMLIFCVFSCTKKENTPSENIDISSIFNSQDSLGKYALQFLYNMYSYLPKGYNRISSGLSDGYSDVLDAGTDDAIPSTANHAVEYFSTSKFNESNLPDNVWDDKYALIRKANIFLANIDVVPLSTKGLKEQWKAEARFLRAMAYFELIKRWSGVPLIKDTIYNVSDNIDVARNSYDECVDYIVSELDSVIEILPSSYSTEFFGRITKGAAMALKAKTLLYAASPLHNESNDLTKWQEAADAAKVLIDSNFYSLVSTYSTLFTTRVTTEVILAYYAATNYTVEENNGPVGSTRGDLGLTSPTQELVDEFEMANGQGITDSGSGYDASNPYANRDPRLALTVFYNGMTWLSRTVQTYDGGLDRPSGYNKVNAGETRTGYYMRKLLSTGGSNTAYANAEHDFPIIRYAEILLDYAEALNEVQGPVAGVYSALEAIRKRAGLSPYALPVGLSQSQMRTRIRHERRVELAFEEQRFWDIRRWKIAENVLNDTLHGIQIVLNSDASYSYNVVSAITATFDASKMYLYPIPFNEMVSNPNMTQNTNW